MSPSRRLVAVADNNQSAAPIHVIDTATRDIVEIPHDGDWLEAMWCHQSDRLLAIVFYDLRGSDPSARILGWSFDPERSVSTMQVDGAGLWDERDLDIVLEGVDADMFFSFTWIGVAPDDSYAVFPVIRKTNGTDIVDPRLLVVDLSSGDLREIANAHGPVGFTPDSSTIVSYRYVIDADGSLRPALVFIDTMTFAEEVRALPSDAYPQYFVTREGNFVVVASNWTAGNMILYDIDRDEMTELGGPEVDLHEFVSRLGAGELWLTSGGELYRLDLWEPILESIDLGFRPDHLNILRNHDWLVMDDVDSHRLIFWDPDDRSPTGLVRLPSDPAEIFADDLRI